MHIWKNSIGDNVEFLHLLVIHSFIDKYLLNVYYVPGTSLDAEDTSVNKTAQTFSPHGAYIFIEGNIICHGKVFSVFKISWHIAFDPHPVKPVG